MDPPAPLAPNPVEQSEFKDLAINSQDQEVGKPAVPNENPDAPAGEKDVGLVIRILARWPVAVLFVILLVMMGLVMGIGLFENVVMMEGWQARKTHASKTWDAFTWARGEARDYMSDGGVVKEEGEKFEALSQEMGMYRYAYVCLCPAYSLHENAISE